VDGENMKSGKKKRENMRKKINKEEKQRVKNKEILRLKR
jgi:hypothetical protein